MKSMTTGQLDQLERDGWVVVPQAVADATVSKLEPALGEAMANAAGAQTRRGETFALRGALSVAAVRALCREDELRALVVPVLGPRACAVRGIVFDKTPGANWKVPWHQDLSIAVREKGEVAGFGPWSEKAGVPHVQPPAPVLEQMLTVRLHLDDCDARNGPLRVLSGSHRAGRLGADEIGGWRERAEAVEVHVPRGGALLMRPLLLHASSPSREPERARRVLHLEWADGELPGGLEWFERV